MASPYFLGVDLTVPTYTWSAGVNSSFPVSNLATYFEADLSKSNATTADQYITIDFGSAVACDTLIAVGHNLGSISADTVLLEADDNSGFTTPETIVASITVATATTPIKETFASKTYRYWRIKFDAAGPLLTAPQFGNIFLGTRLTFDTTYEWDFSKAVPEYSTAETVSLNGDIRMSQSYAGRKKWDLLFRLQSNTFATSWDTFIGTVRGKLRPFYFVDVDGTSINYVHLDSDYTDLKRFRYNQNNIRIPLKSQTTA